MSTVVVGLAHLTAEQLATKAEAVGTAMDKNPTFPSPPVTPADLVKAASDLRARLKAQADARVALKAATAALHAATQATQAALVKQGHYVAVQCDGDEAKAKSAGLDVKAKAVHAHVVAAPTGVTATLGDAAHEARVHWHGGSKSVHEHRVETTTDPSKVDSWVLAGATSSSTLLVEGLATGAHSFRVIAIGADAVSPPSGIATLYVP